MLEEIREDARIEALECLGIPPQPLFGPRSPHWEKVRDEFILTHADCCLCGTGDNLEVHHVRPYHSHPDLELDPENLITLCRVHHFWFGHLGSWSSWNEHVVRDAQEWFHKIKGRP